MKKLKYVGDNKWFLVLGQTIEPGQTVDVDDDTARSLLSFKEGLKQTGESDSSGKPVVTGTEKFIFEEVV